MICDDEPLALARLAALLARTTGAEVVASVRDGVEALASMRDTSPDLLLLDIEMPGLDGFDIVEQLTRLADEGNDAPLVAFVTAYRRFAPEAFDSGAIDFLSKPVRLSRLERTLARARVAMEGREARRRLDDLQKQIDRYRDDQGPWRNAHVWVPRRGEVVRIDLDQIDRVVAEGAYVRLHVEGSSFLHREPIGSLEKRLDPSRYVRVHRSHILRIVHIASLRRTMHGGGELVLRSGERVPLGRMYAKDARRRLFGGTSGSRAGVAGQDRMD